MTRLVFWPGVVLAVGLHTPLAQAQVVDTTSKGRAAIAGVVRDQSGKPLSGVAVMVRDRDLGTTSDDSGHFHLPGLPSGVVSFNLIRLGFAPLSFDATLLADSTVVVAIRLRPAQQLGAVNVTAQRVSQQLGRLGFYERMRAGRGSYITPERIDSMTHVTRPSQFLQDVRGIQVRCGSNNQCVVRTTTGPPCLTLFVDGVYMRDNDQLDLLVSAGSIVAIEVYERPNLVPIEFQAPLPPKRAGPGLMSMAGGCGALVVWTRGRAG